MQAAVKDGALVAPTVGTWRPRVGVGAPLTPGMPLGVLRRAGRDVEVRAPDVIAGVVAAVVAPGAWVAYGEVLCTVGEAVAGGVAAGSPAAAPVAGDAPAGVTVVRAETDGAVYLSPEPGAPPFAPVGAAVGAHGTLALIEVMKTFSPVRSPVGGAVERVLVASGEAVTAGQAMFWVRAG